MRAPRLLVAFGLGLLVAACVRVAPGTGNSNWIAVSPDTVRALTGVWDEIQLKDNERSIDLQRVEKRYSWGAGRPVPNESIEIDLAAEAPFVSLPGFGFFKPVSLTGTDSQVRIRGLNTDQTATAQSMDFTIRLNSDGTLSLRGKVGTAEYGDATYYRSSGP